jgi:cardiolipin synthase C
MDPAINAILQSNVSYATHAARHTQNRACERPVFCLVLLLAVGFGGCSSLPPGAAFPRVASQALTDPQTTTLGRVFVQDQRTHGSDSAFRIISKGADGFLVRMQMVKAAEKYA